MLLLLLMVMMLHDVIVPVQNLVCIVITASICICLTSRAVTGSSTKPGLTAEARKPAGLDASEAAGTSKSDSRAVGDGGVLSKAVDPFCTSKEQDQGAAPKVFTGCYCLYGQ